MKIYAKQVPPEYQESPLIHFDEIPENVFVFGNKDYQHRAEKLFKLIDAANEALDAWDDFSLKKPYYNSWKEALNDLLPPDEKRGEYTREERKKIIPALLIKLDRSNTSEENALYCELLQLITGDKFDHAVIRGCSQGDWQNIIYPAEYGREWVKTFETEYFNLGSEWEVKEDEDDPGYYIYCTTDDPRREIADMANTSPDNVILYAFDGWTRTPKYREV